MDIRIIDRIQKLLALANDEGATEAEANLAMEKAHAIMSEHNLTMATIAASGKKGEEVRTKEGLDGQAMFDYQRNLMAVIAETNYCYVSVIYKYTRRGNKGMGYRIIGTESNVATAKIMFEYLMQTINRLVMVEIKGDYRQRMSRWAISWCAGCAQRLEDRLRERHQNFLNEQKKKAKEAEAASRHPASPSHEALVVVMEDYQQREADLNNDFRMQWEPGTTAANRVKKEASKKETMQRKFAEAKAAGYDDQVAAAYSEYYFDDLQAAFDWCYPSEEKQKKNDEYWKRQDRKEEKRRQREHDKRNWSAYHQGSEAGSKIGLDAQVSKSDPLKSIK